ncbi:MAG: insulinase family protein [Betaproteobacteria bacterium]|nr:insulinase family protein [Betaproteobacteria bacterium]
MHLPLARSWPARLPTLLLVAGLLQLALPLIVAGPDSALIAAARAANAPGAASTTTASTRAKAAAAAKTRVQPVSGAAAAPVNRTAAPLTRVTSTGGITEYRAENGLRLLLLPDASVDTITVNVTYLVGSRHEGYGESGMAHLLEHLLFKGTPRNPDIKAEFQKRGARWNGSTAQDRTNYFETFPSSEANLDWALALEADRMVNAFVAKKDLDSEMTVVRNEFESWQNNPSTVLRENIAATAYLWHGYGRAIIGARSDIENVPIERLQGFYRTYYQPDNAVVVIAGRFDEAAALRLAARHFGSLPKPARSLPQTYTIEPTQDGERTVTLRRSGDIQQVGVLYHIAPGSHPDYAAIDVLVAALGQVPGGRLHKELVVTGKASSVFGSGRQLREAGYAYFGASVRQGLPVEAARHALLQILEGLPAAPLPDAEIERARTRLLNDMEMLLADSRGLALALSETIAQGDWRLLFLHRDRLRAVTTADVQRVAAHYLKPANRTVGLFIPDSAPARAEIPPMPDLAAMLKDYRTDAAVSQGGVFDPTPAAIEARTIRRTLPGGMQLALLPKKTRGNTVVAQLSLRWGDEAAKTGRATACGIASAMLSRGTQKKSREQISNEFNRLRAQVGVGGEGGSITTVRENLPAALALVAEILRQPAFPREEFEQLRQTSLAGIEAQISDPSARAGLEIARHLNPWPEQHWFYNTTPQERIERLKALSLEEVQRCYRDFVGASHAGLSVVGDFDPEEITRVATTLFSDWKSPAPYARVPTPFVAAPPVDRIIETPDKANAVYRAGLNLEVRDDDPDYPALVLGNYLFGGSSTARLAARIREKDGLSYSVGSFFSASSFDRRGSFGIFATHAPQNREALERAVKEELQRVLRDGFGGAEVDAARTGLLKARQVARNQDAGVAGRLLSYLELDRTLAWDTEFERRIAALSPSEILAALRRHLDPERLSVVRAGDFRPKTSAGTLPRPPG